MCGICGIAVTPEGGRSIDLGTIERMCDSISHRGPDDSGVWMTEGIALGHRRLSIVGLESGHQPMSTRDGSLHLVFNGEIYNHLEYRRQLAQRGYSFETETDSEVILHLYSEYGERCVEHLQGMYSFAIWDSSLERLFVARDPFGIKPFYYGHNSDGSLYFGSEIKAVLASGAFAGRANLSVLSDYLANQAPSGEETMYCGIRRLPAGHTLSWSRGEVKVSKYWDLNMQSGPRILAMAEDELVSRWRLLFDQAVESHLMADVPLGVLLSGGIDSTAIAASMHKISGRRFKSFSVAFGEKEANELTYARAAAEHFNTDHHEVLMSPEQYFSLLPRMVWHEDEPLAHSASIPLYAVCKEASKHVKVVLTGEGADELMAGYAKYRTTVANMRLGMAYRRISPQKLRAFVSTRINRGAGGKFRKKLQRTFLARRADVTDLYFDNFSVFTKRHQEQLLTSSVEHASKSGSPYKRQLDLFQASGHDEFLDRLLYVDSKIFLQELLMKQDQMSMAASIESRVPFLDRELADFTARLPASMKLRGHKTKYVLRRAMSESIPRSILDRPKMGFPVPIGTWFRGQFRSLIEEFVTGDRSRDRGLFDDRALDMLVGEHLEGKADNGARLWSLLNLEIWFRQSIDGDGVDHTASTVRRLIH